MRTEIIVLFDDGLKTIVLIDDDQFQKFLIEIILSIDDLEKSFNSLLCSSLRIDLLERPDNKLLRSTLFRSMC